MVLFNNPLNPSATVFPREDLELLARYCEKFDAIAVCDEVWEHVMFDGRRHIPLIAMPGMRERCVKIGSAGKIFSLTGWKVGLVCAAPAVLRVLAKAHQYITFTTPPNLQAAVAYGLGKADDYFEGMRADLQRSRDRFTSGLRSLGFPVIEAEATYFVNVDLASLGLNEDDETLLQAAGARAQGGGDPGLGVLRRRSDPLGGALLLRQARRDARCRAGAARRRAEAGGVSPASTAAERAREVAGHRERGLQARSRTAVNVSTLSGAVDSLRPHLDPGDRPVRPQRQAGRSRSPAASAWSR